MHEGQSGAHTSRSTRRWRRLLMTAFLASVWLVPASAAAAGPSPNGCNGLLNAGYATFSNVGDTHGHETVHHQQDAHDCHHG